MSSFDKTKEYYKSKTQSVKIKGKSNCCLLFFEEYK